MEDNTPFDAVLMRTEREYLRNIRLKNIISRRKLGEILTQ
jgi:hypothetical protein